MMGFGFFLLLGAGGPAPARHAAPAPGAAETALLGRDDRVWFFYDAGCRAPAAGPEILLLPAGPAEVCRCLRPDVRGGAGLGLAGRVCLHHTPSRHVRRRDLFRVHSLVRVSV